MICALCCYDLEFESREEGVARVFLARISRGLAV